MSQPKLSSTIYTGPGPAIKSLGTMDSLYVSPEPLNTWPGPDKEGL